MFETAELGRKIGKGEFKKIAPVLREELLELQERLRTRQFFQVILVFAGVDGGGKGETVSLLNSWMDPRWLETHAYDGDELTGGRPEFWQYWRDLPPKGRSALFLSAWYHQPVLDRVYGNTDEAALLKRLERIVRFERALASDGALILKFWMHLSHAAQETRLKSLEQDPLSQARVTERDWEHWRMYDRFIGAAEQVIARTNRGIAPWMVVEGADPNYRAVTVATTLRDALKRRLERAEAKAKRKSSGEDKKAHVEEDHDNDVAADAITVLSQLDMSHKLDKKDYETRLVAQQARLHLLHLRAKEQKISSVLVFEGPDAAGKGGAIRRIAAALDPRNYQVHGIAAPTEEEKAQHYLWRFWRRLSRAGLITLFDRSWYGRVLVERIEGYAGEDEWRRSYGEINDFETQLVEHGVVVVKFWIHITKDEQLARFKAREKTPYKRWKLTDEDWKNRDRWDDYEHAVNDMVQYTSTSMAPWTFVEGNDKRYARLKVVETYCDRLEAVLEQAGGSAD